MTSEINRWHEEFAPGFLVWKVSDTPPEDLDLPPLDYQSWAALDREQSRSASRRAYVVQRSARLKCAARLGCDAPTVQIFDGLCSVKWRGFLLSGASGSFLANSLTT